MPAWARRRTRRWRWSSAATRCCALRPSRARRSRSRWPPPSARGWRRGSRPGAPGAFRGGCTRRPRRRSRACRATRTRPPNVERRRPVRPLAGRLVGPRRAAVRAAVHVLVSLRGPADPRAAAGPARAGRPRAAALGRLPGHPARALGRAARERILRRRARAGARHPRTRARWVAGHRQAARLPGGVLLRARRRPAPASPRVLRRLRRRRPARGAAGARLTVGQGAAGAARIWPAVAWGAGGLMAEDHRGILNPREGFRHFQLTRRPPAPDLAWCVERHWIVEWDLPEREPYPAQVLPAPTFHLVVEEDGTWLYGVGASRFERRIAGRGRVVGTKFRPGGAHPLLGEPAWRYTDRSLRAREALGAEVPELESIDDQVAATEAFLRERLPAPDDTVARISAIVDTMAGSAALGVEEVAARHGVSVRTLQRLFRRWVGVSPKWVLQRFRLQEAAERVDEIGAQDGAATAVELGYYDQAHFINDFRSAVGRSPRKYDRS